MGKGGIQGRRYFERITPGIGWLALAGVFIVMIAIAYGAALGSMVGLVVAVGTTALALVGFWRSSPTVQVTTTGIQAGRAHLPASAIGEVRTVRGEELVRIRRGQEAQLGAALYSVAPPWSPATAVLVTVTDTADPHAAWLIATRHGAALEAAIDGGQRSKSS